MNRSARLATGALVLALLGLLVWLGFVPLVGERFDVAAYCVEHGHAETGAPNIVSAVYLGYRAYDTLGEAIILVLGVIGTAFLLAEKEESGDE